MPSFLSHYILADSIFNRMLKDKKIQFLISNFGGNCIDVDIRDNKDAFVWGAQGPDPFFVYHSLHFDNQIGLRHYGSKLHRERPCRIFKYMYDISVNTKSHNLPVLFYTLGFISHYSFDSLAHPFIKYKCKQLKSAYGSLFNSRIVHAAIENCLGTLLVHDKKHILPSDIKSETILPENNVINVVFSYIYSKLLYFLFPEFDNNEKNRTRLLSIPDQYKFAIIKSRDTTGIKTAIVETAETILGIKPYVSSYISSNYVKKGVDYANISHDRWDDSENSSNDSFFDIFSKSESLAIDIMSSFLENKDLKNITKDKPFV